MSWWGKIVGGVIGSMLNMGSVFGIPLGVVLGVALGHYFDKQRESRSDNAATLRHQVQATFFTAVFSVMGYVAKADAQVSREEIRLVEAVMRQMALQKEQQQLAQRLFNDGKKPDFPLDEVLAQFRKVCRRHPDLFRIFIEIQMETALADGFLHPGEERALRHIAEALGVSSVDFEQILSAAHYAAGSDTNVVPAHVLADAYKVLGVSQQASDDEVTRAYRRLMNQYHPDKLVSKGLPEEMMNYATEMTRRVKNAYDSIKKARATAREDH